MSALQPPPARLVSPPPAIADDALSITAGRYLTLRREARDLTINQAAHLVAGGVFARTDILAPTDKSLPIAKWLELAETDQQILNDTQLADLRKAFPFDPFIYQCLRDGIPSGRICSGCGCSWEDACTSRDGRSCAWVSERPGLCSLCLLDADRAVPAPTIGSGLLDALRPFAAAAKSIASACPDDRAMEFRFTAGQFRDAARAVAQAGAR